MRPWHLFAFLSIALLPAAALAEQAGIAYPVTYAGGSLPLNHNKVRAAFGKDEVVFMQRGRRIAVPVKSITEISCGTEVRRRLGASVLDVVPLMHLGEIETYYIGVAWTWRQRNSLGRASAVEVEPRRISRFPGGARTVDRHQSGGHQSGADRRSTTRSEQAQLAAAYRR